MFYQPSGENRRRSLDTLTVAQKPRQRSSSMGLIEASPITTISYSQRGPATPCFVSPRMAFSTQFGFDSPIQVLTSSSPGIFKPMAVPALPGRCSLKRLPYRYKMMLTIALLCFAASMFFLRNLKDKGSKGCTDDTCDESRSHPHLKRFLRNAEDPVSPHTLTADLVHPNEGVGHLQELIDESTSYQEDDLSHRQEITPQFGQSVNSFHKVNVGVKKVIGSEYKPESNIAEIDSNNLRGEDGTSSSDSGMNVLEVEQLDQQSTDVNLKANPEGFDPTRRNSDMTTRNKRVFNDNGASARVINSQRSQPANQRRIQFERDGVPALERNRRLHSDDVVVQRRSNQGMRMERLPPGVNPLRYRNEF